jgi:hypothetical protein
MKTKAITVQKGIYTFKTHKHGKITIVLPNFKIQAFDDNHLFFQAFTDYKLETGLEPTSLFLDDKQIY